MPGQSMRVSACTVAFNAIHGKGLREGEGLVPSHSAAARQSRQCGQGQVGPRSGQCRRCVRARAERSSESDGRRPGSYESSEAGLKQDSGAGREVSGEAASGRAWSWGGWEA
eukprot:3668366-Pleurochrysis_carterae.AAC.1